MTWSDLRATAEECESDAAIFAPETVLALLDENDRLRYGNDSLRAEREGLERLRIRDNEHLLAEVDEHRGRANDNFDEAMRWRVEAERLQGAIARHHDDRDSHPTGCPHCAAIDERLWAHLDGGAA